MLFTSSPSPPIPRAALPYLSFPIILSLPQNTMTFEISAPCRSCFPWSVNFLGFLLAACSKVFGKVSLSLMKEQVSQLAKSAVVQYVTVFHLILAKRMKHWSRARDKKASYCEIWCRRWRVSGLKKYLLGVKTIRWEQKLMLISDQARVLVKICFEGRRPFVPFGSHLSLNGSSTSGILNKSTV